MRARPSLLLLSLLIVPLLGLAPALAQELAPADRDLLEGLLGTTLFDPPPDAGYVLVSTEVRTVWATSERLERPAWWVPGRGDEPARLVFVDGFGAPPHGGDPAALPRLDLAAEARERLRPRGEDEEREERFAAMARAAGRAPLVDPRLALAAWLHRRGEDGLAGELLADVRAAPEPGQGDAGVVAALRGELAWEHFAALVHAYMVRADDEALAHGEHLLARYPLEAAAEPQAADIVAELRRRGAAGTAGRTPPAGPPEGFAERSVAEQVAWLIEALDEVDVRQWGQPGGVDLASDWRVEALIRLGDAAVPALIDAIERDERLTRSVHFWRDFARSRTVLSVREAALVAVMSILRLQVFEPRATGDNFTAHGPEQARDTARRLRDYWEQNRGLTLEQRMRRVLTDDLSTQEQMREAARNLAELTGERRIGSMVWGSRTGPAPTGAQNPALALTDPTAAEAILAAMDRDLARGDPHWRDDPHMALYSRRNAETHYVECLIALGDRRLLPEARRRAEQATEMRLRRQWGLLCHALGDPAPMAAFLADFAAGKLLLPPIADPPRGQLFDEPGAVELVQCAWTFLRLESPEAERALAAAAEPGHPYRDALARLVLAARDPDARALFARPWYLPLLLPELERTEPTGTRYRVEGEMLHQEGERWSSTGPLQPERFGGAELAASASERRCDVAAERLAGVLIGLPPYHPLLKDRDARLARIRADCARFVRGARLATPQELAAVGLRPDPWGPARFIPGVAPLGRPATAEDVRTGRAVFHLAGQGRVAEVDLPALGRLRLEEGGEAPVLVVQAEELPSGERRYGVIGAEAIREVGAEQLVEIALLPDPQAQRAAAKQLLDAARAGDLEAVQALLGPQARDQVERLGGLEQFVGNVRAALEAGQEGGLVERLAPAFRAGADGSWRLERLE